MYSRIIQPLDTEKPVLKFFEDGEWLKIEAQGQPIRYIKKKMAVQILAAFRNHSFEEKSDLIII